VLITKALIEIPPKFANQPPVHLIRDRHILETEWHGVQGLADNVRYYGQWMRAEAEKRIGHFYPKVRLPKEQGDGEAMAIAWLWARTVRCPNPACGAQMPLVRSFWLSTKRGKKTWVNPVVDKQAKTVRFTVNTGDGVPPAGTVNRRGTRCIVCDIPVPFEYVRAEGKAGRLNTQLMAIVAEGHRGRIYLLPTREHEVIAAPAEPKDVPETNLPEQALGFRVQLYGMTMHRDLFTPRQFVALTTFSDLVSEVRMQVLTDAAAAGLPNDGRPLYKGGNGATAYADAVATYLAFAVDKTAEYSCTIVPWYTKEDRPKGLFARQAIPMVWDFAEINPLGSIGGTFLAATRIIADAFEGSPTSSIPGHVMQKDATGAQLISVTPVVCSDPPYYANVGYATSQIFSTSGYAAH
jgi:putative DNA methylase